MRRPYINLNCMMTIRSKITECGTPFFNFLFPYEINQLGPKQAFNVKHEKPVWSTGFSFHLSLNIAVEECVKLLSSVGLCMVLIQASSNNPVT